MIFGRSENAPSAARSVPRFLGANSLLVGLAGFEPTTTAPLRARALPSCATARLLLRGVRVFSP